MNSVAFRRSLDVFAALSDRPFDCHLFEQCLRDVGWETTREGFGAYGVGFHCWTPPVDGYLLACFSEGDECVALGLQAVGDVDENPAYLVESKAKLDSSYVRHLEEATGHLGEPSQGGSYTCQNDPVVYFYACWVYAESFLLLMEYPETDLSNNPSLDLRIVPRHGAHSPTLPLSSNVVL